MQTNSSKAIVWTQNNCQYCNMAKGLLSNKGYAIEERRIGMDEGNWTKDALYRAVPDARSVPQIFIDGKHIGGFKELKEFLSNDNN